MERKSALKELIPKSKNLARDMRETQVQPIHLLITMLALSNGTCRQILEDMQVDISGMLEEARCCADINENGVITLPVLSPRTNKLLEKADHIAEEGGEKLTGTEHLLLAFATSRASNIRNIFKKYGVTYADITDAIKGIKQLSNVSQEQAVKPKSDPDDKSNDWLKDLTAAAGRGELDGAFERDAELEQLVCALLRRRKNCPALIGEPGVGKTAIVEELARRIAVHAIPELAGTTLLSVDVSSMLAGTRYRGQFEERLNKTLKKAEEDGCILFIDEAHTVIGAGDGAGGLDMSNILKPYMARGMRFILATTTKEYRNHIEKDGALARRAIKIEVQPPTPKQTISIVESARPKYESHHKVIINDECVREAVNLSVRYIPDRQLPDKAFDVIDESCSAASLCHEEELSVARVRAVVASLSRVDIDAGAGSVADFGNKARRLIRGQNEAVETVHRALMRAAAGLREPQHPTACFLFLGPSGVGKTELAKTIAAVHMGSADNLIRIDCSELMERASVSKLVGSPPGYVGHEEGGQLTERVRQKPYSVVLFDEIEKAHPEVWNLLLQLLDDGRLTDSFGRTVNFSNCVVILTGNVGANVIKRRAMGFAKADDIAGDEPDLKSNIMAAVKKTFPPEFINRLDETVVFHQLNQETLGRIAADEIGLIIGRCSRKVDCDQGVIDAVVKAAQENDPDGGARMIKRLVVSMIADPLSDALLATGRQNTPLLAECVDGRVCFSAVVQETPARLPELAAEAGH